MNTTESNDLSGSTSSANQQVATSPATRLTQIKQKLQIASEQLQSLQEELGPKDQRLELAYQAIQREGEQLRVMQKMCEQVALLASKTNRSDQTSTEHQMEQTQRLESLGILASSVAHDLSNVLTPILSATQLLQLSVPDLDERSRAMLQVVEDSAKRGTNLIKQILNFTQGNQGEYSPVQMAPLIQEVANVLQTTLPSSIHLHQIGLYPTPWPVSIEPTHLHQILMNLCVNARDAMPDGGALTLTVENCAVDQAFAQTHLTAQVGNYVVITVADTGIGIPPELRDRIFEPFFTTKPSGQGNGLGLATIAGIVKTYRGFLQVSSEVGQGTSVKVYLPAFKKLPASYEYIKAADVDPG